MKRSLMLWEYLFFLAKWSSNLIYFSLRSHRWINIEIPYNQDSVTQTLSHFLILRIQGGLLPSIPDMYFIFIHSDFNSTPVIWTQVISCHCLGFNLSDIYIMIIVRSETALLTSHISYPDSLLFLCTRKIYENTGLSETLKLLEWFYCQCELTENGEENFWKVCHEINWGGAVDSWFWITL